MSYMVRQHLNDVPRDYLTIPMPTPKLCPISGYRFDLRWASQPTDGVLTAVAPLAFVSEDETSRPWHAVSSPRRGATQQHGVMP